MFRSSLKLASGHLRARSTAPTSSLAPTAPRLFTSSATQRDIGKDKEHALDKGPKKDPNIQSYESNQGRKNRAQDTGGVATEQKDKNASTAKAKKEFPEAPDTVIGMQDERGGKGH